MGNGYLRHYLCLGLVSDDFDMICHIGSLRLLNPTLALASPKKVD